MLGSSELGAVRFSALTLKRAFQTSLILLYAGLVVRSPANWQILTAKASYTVYPPIPSSTTLLQGKNWHFLVPFTVQNSSTIEKLIQCESQGVNVARPDSNGLESWGILQFNGTSTWNELSAKSGIRGSPMMPADAIRMADWAISNGYLKRWSCARILKLTT
jgi:hypothetical protein